MSFWKTVVSRAIGTSLGSIPPVIVTAGILYVAWRTYREQFRERSYDALDSFYLNILKIAIEFPYLRSKAFIESTCSKLKDEDEKALRYDSYAFIVWNFIETICDRCHDPKGVVTDPSLWNTWAPIVSLEGNLHIEWFNKEENRKHFKDEFIRHKRINELIPISKR